MQAKRHSTFEFRYWSVLLLCLTGLLVSGPARSQQTPKSAADYWPFREGNTWTLVVTVGGKKMTQVVTVTKVTKTEGKTRAELDYKSDGRSVQLEVYEVDAGSISRVAAGLGGANKLSPPMPVVQFPLTNGKKWSWKGDVAAGNSTVKGSAQLTASGPESIKSEAGTFSAMRVHVDLQVVAGEQTIKVVNDYWFAPAVGLVKQQATIGSQVIEGIVTSYKLVK